MKTIWIFANYAIALFVSALVVFPLSAYLGSGTNDPDAYEVYGFSGSLGLLFLAGIFGIAALGLLLYERNQKKKLVERLLP